LLVDPVRRQQRGAALIAVADDLEQAVGAELVDRQVAQLVDAQDLGLDVGCQRPLEATGGMRRSQRIDDVDGAGEQHRVPTLARCVAQGRHQMALAQADA